MNRIKSRNIVLAVCGGFFFVIILFSIFLGILKIIDIMNEISIYDNVLLSSSKIEVNGGGNFYESTPTVSETTIKDFNVKLKKQGDSAKFIAKFCNVGKDDLLIDNISYDKAVCNDGVYDIECEGIEIKGYIKKDNDNFNSGQCIDFVIKVESLINHSEEVILSINEYKLDLVKINNK